MTYHSDGFSFFKTVTLFMLISASLITSSAAIFSASYGPPASANTWTQYKIPLTPVSP